MTRKVYAILVVTFLALLGLGLHSHQHSKQLCRNNRKSITVRDLRTITEPLSSLETASLCPEVKGSARTTTKEAKTTEVTPAAVDQTVSDATRFEGETRDVRVVVTAAEGVFPAGTEMRVTPASAETTMAAAQKQCDDEQEVVDAVAADITFWFDGREIQPDGNVDVQLVAKRAIEGEEHAAVTVMGDGIAEVVGEANAGMSTFSTNHFTVYAIVGKTYGGRNMTKFARDVYHFHMVYPKSETPGQYDTIFVQTQIVKDGDTLNEPAIPAGFSKREFLGWYVKGATNPLTFGPYSLPAKAKNDTFLVYPRFRDLYKVVFYSDTTTAVIRETKTGINNQEVTTDDVTMKDSTTKVFKGWTDTTASRNPVVNNTVTINNQDIDLIPNFVEGVYVYFESLGGSDVPTQHVALHAKATIPPPPTYTGYDFVGWYPQYNAATGEYDNETFDFDGSIEYDTILYAKWKKHTSAYRIKIWYENADDQDYTLIDSLIRTGNVDSDIPFADLLNEIVPLYLLDGFHLNGTALPTWYNNISNFNETHSGYIAPFEINEYGEYELRKNKCDTVQVGEECDDCDWITDPETSETIGVHNCVYSYFDDKAYVDDRVAFIVGLDTAIGNRIGWVQVDTTGGVQNIGESSGSLTIKEDGSTVVNIFYSRDTYRLLFRFGRAAEITSNDWIQNIETNCSGNEDNTKMVENRKTRHPQYGRKIEDLHINSQHDSYDLYDYVEYLYTDLYNTAMSIKYGENLYKAINGLNSNYRSSTDMPDVTKNKVTYFMDDRDWAWYAGWKEDTINWETDNTKLDLYNLTPEKAMSEIFFDKGNQVLFDGNFLKNADGASLYPHGSEVQMILRRIEKPSAIAWAKKQFMHTYTYYYEELPDGVEGKQTVKYSQYDSVSNGAFNKTIKGQTYRFKNRYDKLIWGTYWYGESVWLYVPQDGFTCVEVQNYKGSNSPVRLKPLPSVTLPSGTSSASTNINEPGLWKFFSKDFEWKNSYEWPYNSSEFWTVHPLDNDYNISPPVKFYYTRNQYPVYFVLNNFDSKDTLIGKGNINDNDSLFYYEQYLNLDPSSGNDSLHAIATNRIKNLDGVEVRADGSFYKHINGIIYKFGGWYADSLYENEAVYPEVMPYKALTFYGKWEPDSVNVTFHFGNGDPDTVITVKYNHPYPVEDYTKWPDKIKKPTWDNHTFIRWMQKEDGGITFNFKGLMKHDTDLYALWYTLTTYQVLYHQGDKGTFALTEDPHTYIEGAKAATLGMATPNNKVDSIFAGWCIGSITGDTLTTGLFEINSDNDLADGTQDSIIHLYAVYAPIPRDSTVITYFPNYPVRAASSDTTIDRRYVINDDYVIKEDNTTLDFSIEGYRFAAWTPDGGSGIFSPNETRTLFFKEDTIALEKYNNKLYALWIPKKTLYVTKVWDDDNNRDNKRPASVEVKVKADDNVINTMTFTNASNQQTQTMTVDAYSEFGPIEYTLEELSVPDGYKATYDYTTTVLSEPGADNDSLIVTNTHVPDSILVVVTKIWDDESSAFREPMLLQLSQTTVPNAEFDPYNVGAPWTAVEDGGTGHTTLADTNSLTWKLPVFVNGDSIYYAVNEIGVLAGYHVIYPHNGKFIYSDGVLYDTIINKAVDPVVVTDIPVLKNLSGRAWLATDTFEMVLLHDEHHPMPANTDTIGTTIISPMLIVKDSITINDTARLGHFGAITFKAEHLEGKTDSTFTYHIREYTPGESGIGRIAGITYGSERYEVDIKIKTGATALELDNIKYYLVSGGERTLVDTPKILNIYNDSITYYHVVAEKELTVCGSNVKHLEDNDFAFVLTPVGELKDYAPMPQGTVTIGGERYDTAYNEGSVVRFNTSDNDGLKFSYLDLKAAGFTDQQLLDTLEFEYELYEVIPGDAVNNDDGTYSRSVVTTSGDTIDETYDALVHFRSVLVWMEITGGKVVLHVKGGADDHQSEYYEKSDGTNEPVASTSPAHQVRHTTTGVPSFRNARIGRRHLPVEKYWIDSNDTLEKRPVTVTVTVYADGVATDSVAILNADNDWKYTFKHFPIATLNEDFTLDTIMYTIVEDDVWYYTTAITGDMDSKFVLTNTIEQQFTEIPVTKNWADNSDQDGYRPGSITFTLTGTTDDSTFTRTLDVVGTGDRWIGTFENLPVFDDARNVFEYTLAEPTVPEHYTANINEYTVTNTHTPEDTTLAVLKIWNDTDNQDGIRPGSVTVKLIANSTDSVNFAVLNASNNWQHKFTELPKYKNGSKINYSIEEINVPDGYTPAYRTKSGTSGDTLIVTNTHVPELITINGTKVWNNDDISNRPENITIRLYADGTELTDKATTVTAPWIWNFTDLPKYRDAGTEIVYTISEDAVPGYTTTITNTSYDFVVTNTPVPDIVKTVNNDEHIYIGSWTEEFTYNITTTIPVMDGLTSFVIYDTLDENLAFANAPTATVDGEAVSSTTSGQTLICEVPTAMLTSKQGKTVSISFKAKFKEGKSYADLVGYENYSVPNKASYKINENFITKVSDTVYVTPAIVCFKGKKTWDDNDNRAGKRPNSIAVEIKNGTEVLETIHMPVGGKWEYTSKNYPVFNASGDSIEYTVVEQNITDYNAPEYSEPDTNALGDTITVNITNTYVEEPVTVTVNKIWNDEVNIDGSRPTSIIVNLYADDVKQTDKSVTLPIGSSWSYTWENLQRYRDGQTTGELIVYTVDEEEVPSGYTRSIEGTTITNSYTPERVNIPYRKIWNDYNDQDGLRPTTAVTFGLFKNDATTPFQTQEVNAAENIHNGVFADLLKKENGVEVTYSVKELDPATNTWINSGAFNTKYTTTMIMVNDTFVFTNTHTPDSINLMVVKKWDDNDNDDGLRTPVKVVLYQTTNTTLAFDPASNNPGWTVVGDTINLGTVNNASTEWRLPVYTNGLPIRYAAKEVSTHANYVTTYAHGGVLVPANDYIDTITNRHKSLVNIALDIQKELSGRVWFETDTFAMALVPVPNGNPMPEDVILSGGISYSMIKMFSTHEAISESVRQNSFGDITFTMDDLEGKSDSTFVYRITELTPAASGLTNIPGMTYSGTVYQAEITVSEVADKDSLQASVAYYIVPNDDSKTAAELLRFTNVYNDSVVTYKLNAFKNLMAYDAPGLSDGEFQFVLKPVGEHAAIAPMPAGTTGAGVNRADTVTNKSTTVEFYNDDIEGDGLRFDYDELRLMGFSDEDLAEGVRFDYEMREVIPTGAVRSKVAGIDSLNTDGITTYYDAVVHHRTLVIKMKEVNGKVVLSADNDFSVHRDYFLNGSDTTWLENSSVAFTKRHGPNGAPVFLNFRIADTAVAVNKVWIDGNNAMNTRPENLTVTLLASPLANQTATLNQGNGWSYRFTGLPTAILNNALGFDTIKYSVTEAQVSGYDVPDYSGNAADGYEITNTLTQEIIEIPVSKVWADASNQDGFRPASIALTLTGTTAGGSTLTRTLDAIVGTGDQWDTVFKNLPKYDDARYVYVYTLSEPTTPEHYEQQPITDFTVTNTHTPEDTTLAVKKLWDDANNQDGMRTSSVTVKLLANGDSVNVATLNDGNNWQAQFTELPKYANGTKINYSIQELVVPTNYTVAYGTITSADSDTLTVTNTHTPEDTTLAVLKVWDDVNNQDGIRTENVTVKLLANGDSINVATLNADNNWKAKFSGLDKYANGTKINYSIQELVVPTNYTVAYGTITSADGDTLTVTNTHIPDSIDIFVEKIWNDNGNNDGFRPSSINVQLLAGTFPTITLNEANSWKGTFGRWPKFEAGYEIAYIVAEEEVEKYTTQVMYGNNNDNTAINVTITNTHVPETVDITVYKHWDDNNNADGTRTPITVQLYSTLDGTLTFADDSDNDGWTLRDEKTITSLADYATATWTNLPKYYHGTLIRYAVREKATPNYYVRSYSNGNEMTVANHYTDTITNLYKSPVDVTLEVAKLITNRAWFDTDTFAMALFAHPKTNPMPETTGLVNGTPFSEIRITNADSVINDSVRLGMFPPITFTMSDLKGKSDSVFLYTIRELAPNVTNLNAIAGISYSLQRFEVKIHVTKDDRDSLHASVEYWATHRDDGVDIPDSTVAYPVVINRYDEQSTVERISANKSLAFTGDDNYLKENEFQFKMRPVGQYADKAPMPASVTTGTGADRVLTVTNTFNEIRFGADEGFLFSYVDLHNLGFTDEQLFEGVDFAYEAWEVIPENAVNHDNGLMSLKVGNIETYYDAVVHYRQLNVRIEEAPGEVIMLIVTPVENTLFDEYYIKNNGDTVKLMRGTPESDLRHLKKSPLFRNARIVDTAVAVTKIWNDQENENNRRPASVAVTLYADGQPTDNIATLNEDNGWKHTFTGIPFTKLNDQLTLDTIVYTVVEEPVNHYLAPVYGGNAITGFKITNTLDQVYIDIPVTKVWDDRFNNDGFRPDSVTLTIVGTTESDTVTFTRKLGGVVSATESAHNTWDSVFTDLPKYDSDLNAYDYTLSEEEVPYYTTLSVTGDIEEGFTVTNNHRDSMVTFTLKKEWEDNGDQDGIRPAEVTVRVEDESALDDELIILSTDNQFTRTVSRPKFVNREVNEISVQEYQVPNGYTVSYTGSPEDGQVTITNTHVPDSVDILVSKIWDDHNNNDGIRPASISVNLYANGDSVDTRTITGTGHEWETSFGKWPVKNNGDSIEYSLSEAWVSGYQWPSPVEIVKTTAGVYKMKVTNTHKLDSINLTAVKVWDDDHLFNMRSDVTMVLFRSYNPTATFDPEHLPVNGNSDWAVAGNSFLLDSEIDTVSVTWAHMPKYYQGTEIRYAVKEINCPEHYSTSYTFGGELTESNDYTDTVTNSHAAFEPATLADLAVQKKLLGRQWLGTDIFEMALIPVDADQPMPANVDVIDGLSYAPLFITPDSTFVNDSVRLGTFEPIIFTSDDMAGSTPKTFVYHIRELYGSESDLERIVGMTYGMERYEVDITVAVEGNTLIVSDVAIFPVYESYDDHNMIIETLGDQITGHPMITNLYRDSVTVYHMVADKQLTVVGLNESLQTGDYRFVLKPVGANADKAPMPQGAQGTGSGRTDTVSNEGNAVHFFNDALEGDGLRFDYTELIAAGFNDAQLHEGVEFEYEMHEVIPEGATFNDDSTFTWTLTTVNSQGIMVDEIYDGIVHFRKIHVQMEEIDGKVVLHVTSGADDHLHDYYINGNGDTTLLELSSPLYPKRHGHGGVPIFRNARIARIDVSVEKIWDDWNNALNTRPESITVTLMANGVATDSIAVLNEDNEWAYTFKNLKAAKSTIGLIEYSVQEVSVDNYETTYRGDMAEGYVIVNTLAGYGEETDCTIYVERDQLSECPEIDCTPVTDADGYTYAVVKIDGYCWMAENLRTQTPNAMSYQSAVSPDAAQNMATYGYLYTWFDAAGGTNNPEPIDGYVRGVCPNGWHLPTAKEINVLMTNSSDALRSESYWAIPAEGANSTGFNALPAGYYNAAAQRFEGLHSTTLFHGDTPSSLFSLEYYCCKILPDQQTLQNGYSVRCVKDCE